MYPVDLHMHTVASTHAYSTLHDYIAIAKAKGLKLFAITDHGPDMADAPHHWHFINMSIWPRLVDGVGILRGIEANIKNTDGEIDCTGPMLDSLDLIIAGFHEPVFAPQDQQTHTEAGMYTSSATPEIQNIPLIFRRLLKPPQNIRWRWKSITRPLFIRVRAARRTAGRLPPPCAMPGDGSRWDRIRIPRFHWAILPNAVRCWMT